MRTCSEACTILWTCTSYQSKKDLKTEWVITCPSGSPTLMYIRITWRACWNTDCWALDSVGLQWSLWIFIFNSWFWCCWSGTTHWKPQPSNFSSWAHRKTTFPSLTKYLGLGQWHESTISKPGPKIPRTVLHTTPWPYIEDGSLSRWKAARSVNPCIEESCLVHIKLPCKKGISLVITRH